MLSGGTGNTELLSPRWWIVRTVDHDADAGSNKLLSALISPRGGLRHPSRWPAVSRADFGW